MKIIYAATDGTIFDTEDKCIAYERSINIVSTLCKDLVIEDKIIPISILLNNYLNDAGYLVPIEHCRFENFIIKSRSDIFKIKEALKDLGYNCLADAIDNDINVYPDILCIMSTKKDTNTFKYSKYSYLNKQIRIIEKQKDYILDILSKYSVTENEDPENNDE